MKTIIFGTIENFSLQKTLLIALIGALIGQLMIILVGFLKKKINLQRKKSMILNDLKNQNEILDSLTKKHLELADLFKRKQVDTFTTSIFHTLQLDIYESIPKNELYQIFQKDLFKLVDIYKSIEFLKNHSPYWIHRDYLEKSELHLEEEKNNSEHNFWCETHLGFIDIALGNIENNFKTINQIKKDIKELK